MAAQPERTCTGCRGRAPKGELLRVARSPQGAVAFDRTGKAPGRGGYVHRDLGCIAAAMDRGGVGRVLKVSLSPEELATLRTEMEKALQ